MRCLACNKILSDYESTRGILVNGQKQYLDMCVKCDDTPEEKLVDNPELITDEFDGFDDLDEVLNECESQEFDV